MGLKVWYCYHMVKKETKMSVHPMLKETLAALLHCTAAVACASSPFWIIPVISHFAS